MPLTFGVGTMDFIIQPHVLKGNPPSLPLRLPCPASFVVPSSSSTAAVPHTKLSLLFAALFHRPLFAKVSLLHTPRLRVSESSESSTYILPPDHRCRRGWVAGQEFFLRCKSLLANVVLIKDISYIHLFGTTKNWHTPRMFFCVGTRFHCPATQPNLSVKR